MMIGRSIAHYQITDRIGAGGMGEVYRARDGKLGRDVALKVLPEAFAGDPERVMRFEREARLLASLNHAHIATIHGIERDGATHVLVMELADGEDLAQRIARGPLPVDECLVAARQVTDALEAAHEQGVIHRDLKPANIVMTPDGGIKVLDFGLAKAIEGDASTSGLSQSPTVLGNSPTVAGVILGTAAYMSPEQARGKRVDRRADIFAFGCVLYEMLTGRQAFGGDTVSDTLAAVLRAEPEWSALPADTPASIRTLLRRCLEKDPKQRLRDIGEARIVLDAALRGEHGVESAPTPAALRRGRSVWVWALSGLAVICAAGWFLASRGTPASEERLLQVSVVVPPDTPLRLQGAHPAPPAVSPNGRYVAFGLDTPSGAMLAVRDLARDDIRTLAGTDGVGYPFWSPDSRQVAFFGGGRLKRVDITGGAPVVICNAEVGKGGTWRADGTILFAPSYATAIFRVPATGGTPVAVTHLDSTLSESSHRFPQFLPDGEHFLYVVRNFGGADAGGHTLRVASLDRSMTKDLFATETAAVYADGYLFLVRENTLIAQPFDAKTFAVTGDPVTIAENVQLLSGAAHAVFDVSPAGVAVYQRGEGTMSAQLILIDGSGREIGPLGANESYSVPVRMSPDGSLVLIGIFSTVGGTADLWLIDAERGAKTRFTFDPAHDSQGTWSPDGSRIAFTSNRPGGTGPFAKPLRGNTAESRVIETETDLFVAGWSPDGRYLLCHELGTGGQGRLRAIPLAQDAPDPLPADALPRSLGGVMGLYRVAFSPDGNWLAYESAEGGRGEIYAIPFGKAGRKWQVTLSGGDNPHWVGRHVYFQKDREIWKVSVESRGENLVIGAEVKVYGGQWVDDFDVSRDESRIVILRDNSGSRGAPLSVIVNWRQMLRAQR